MKPYAVNFLFIIITSVLQSQTIYVFDKKAKSPISYASISYDGGGFYTNADGSFNTSLIPKKSKNISISILGYKDLKIDRNQIDDTIFLTPKIHKLKEVTITNRKKEITIKPQKNIFINHQSFPAKKYSELCTCLYPKEYVNSKIDKVTFRFNRNKWSSNFTDEVRAILKFNVYAGSDTLFQNKIYQTKKFKIPNQNTDLSINFEDSNIFFYEAGICFSIEMIGYSKDGILLKTKSSVRPVLHKKKSKYYRQKTYIKPVFNDTILSIPLIDFINKGRMKNKPYERRNLSIGFKLKY